MSSKKTFLLTFLSSLIVIFIVYSFLYFSISNEGSQDVQINQEGIAILKPSVDDSKAVLINLESEEESFFFILKLNAIQNKLSLLSIDKNFVLPSLNRSLQESITTAGIMQASFDISKEFDFTIDYYLRLDLETLAVLLEGFDEISLDSFSSTLPEEIKVLLLTSIEKIDTTSLVTILEKSDEFLATNTGLGFLNELIFIIVKDNLTNQNSEFKEVFKDTFSYVQTNINSEDLDKLERIIALLNKETCVFKRDVIFKSDGEYLLKVNEMLLQ